MRVFARRGCCLVQMQIKGSGLHWHETEFMSQMQRLNRPSSYICKNCLWSCCPGRKNYSVTIMTDLCSSKEIKTVWPLCSCFASHCLFALSTTANHHLNIKYSFSHTFSQCMCTWWWCVDENRVRKAWNTGRTVWAGDRFNQRFVSCLRSLVQYKNAFCLKLTWCTLPWKRNGKEKEIGSVVWMCRSWPLSDGVVVNI